MRYEILLRNKNHEVTIIPYAIVSHIGVDTLLSRVCEANEEERRIFFKQLEADGRNRYIEPRSPFVLAVVAMDKANVPLSLSPSDFLDYGEREDIFDHEDQVDCIPVGWDELFKPKLEEIDIRAMRMWS